jgi:hypothetical protein
MIPRTKAAAARLACALVLLAFPGSRAGAQPVGYSLSPGSEFRTGCFDLPCACGPVQNAMTGSFGLIRQTPAPPYVRYDVVGVNWEVDYPNVGIVTITGSGTYRVGGTGAIQQQLSLDLVVGSGRALHFDSGLVPGGTDFPRIEADISLYGELACADTLLRVRAGPGGVTLGVDVLGVGTPALTLGPVGPNPFRAVTRLAFTLRDDGPVRVSIHDAAGRLVRTLADGDWLAAGPHAVEWDGKRDDGRRSEPGLYFVSVRSPGATERASVIRLR